MHWVFKVISVASLVLGAVAIIIAIVLVIKVDDNAEDAAENDRMAAFEACKRGNEQLRAQINQHIVRPFHDVVAIAATPSGDPAFDVFVPNYQAALDTLEPVPYQICRNAQPPDGSEPHPPFYRRVPLPPPLQVDRPRQQSRGQGGEDASAGATTSTAPTATAIPQALPVPSGNSVTPPPTQSPQQGPQGDRGPEGPEGDDAPPPIVIPPTEPPCEGVVVLGICLLG